MSSFTLNKTQVNISKFTIETYVAQQTSYLIGRTNFVSKVKKEILELIKISENKKITEAKYCKAANHFHQNIKKLIGKEKLKLIHTNKHIKQYSSIIQEIERLLSLKYKVRENGFDVNRLKFKILGKSNSSKYLKQINKRNNSNINYYYFRYRLTRIIFDETFRIEGIIADNYLSLYKAIVIFNNRYHSKIFEQRNEIDIEEIPSTEGNSLVTELDKVINTFKEIEKSIKETFIKKIEILISNYEESYEEIENSNKLISKYSEKNIYNEEVNLHSKIEIKNNKHNNFYKGLFGNWFFFEDISALNYFVIYEFFETRDNLNVKLHNEILTEFNKISKLLSLTKIEVEREKGSDDFISYLKNKKQNVKHRLEDDLLIQIVRLLPYDNPAPLIKTYLSKVKGLISKFPEQRTITNLAELDYSAETNLHTFSSKEIIENNIFNSAFNNLSELSKKARLNVKKISSDVLDLGRISDYNFETAISVETVDNKPNKKVANEHSAYKIAVEGTDRIIDKCNHISNQLAKISEQSFEEFNSSVKKFTDNLYTLNNSDELLKLKLKLSREKAKEEAQIRIEKIQNNIKNFIPLLVTNTKTLYANTKKKIFKISEKVGLTSTTKEVSEEILDYIIETEKQISSLPFVYQRLFKNLPVNDKRFFIGRKKELDKIRKAYKHWENEKFAPTVVVSEKGAGASSLTNMAQEEFEQALDVIHIKLSNTIYESEDFLNLLVENFNFTDCTTLKELVVKINKNEKKQVIIIENIEDLFLRVVNGFDVIKEFAQIISLTNNRIFWIATCNKYAWNYLSKVINIDDYFAFVIKFDNLTNEKIKEIIMTRHNMSGHKLKYIPSENNLDDKQFGKMNETEQYEYLADMFFAELNSISQSNIALAQLFWLRSISKFEDGEIYLSSLHNIDFSFLKNLNRQKIFSLAAILIHDGLTVEEHAMVFNITNEESRLLLSAMLDDGELRKGEDNYRVNFLLYVHIIKLLKSQNILH